jgi:hypothetical protein
MSKSDFKRAVVRRRSTSRPGPVDPKFLDLIDLVARESSELDELLDQEQGFTKEIEDIFSNASNSHRIEDGIKYAEVSGANALAVRLREKRKRVAALLEQTLAFDAGQHPGVIRMKAVALLEHIDREPRRQSSLADRWLAPLLRQSYQAITR